jgi:hypothetical protein
MSTCDWPAVAGEKLLYRWTEIDRGSTRALEGCADGIQKLATELPIWLRVSDEGVWPSFRVGAAAGQPLSDSQFPVAGLGGLSKQAVPDLIRGAVKNRVALSVTAPVG